MLPTSPLLPELLRGGVILLSQEPPVERNIWHKKSFRHFDRVFSFWDDPDVIHTQTALPWHIDRSYDELAALPTGIDRKKDKVSWCTSNQLSFPGHRQRMMFKDFLTDNGFEFDLYGRGFNPVKDKFDAIYPYKYSIAIENCSCDDYWTEKIADCFLSWTIPIYHGAKNITKYFPEKSMILIDPDKPREALDIIRKAVSDDIYAERIPYLQEARELILDKYQFFPWVARLVKESGIRLSSRKWHYIPMNSFYLKMYLDLQVANLKRGVRRMLRIMG